MNADQSLPNDGADVRRLLSDIEAAELATLELLKPLPPSDPLKLLDWLDGLASGLLADLRRACTRRTPDVALAVRCGFCRQWMVENKRQHLAECMNAGGEL